MPKKLIFDCYCYPKPQLVKTILFLSAFLSLLLCQALRAQDDHVQQLPVSISDPMQSEALPVISVDGTYLFFTRAREGFDGSTVLDIWRSVVQADGTFTDPE